MPIRSIGVDPGLAKTGIAAVECQDDGTLVSRGVRLVQTKPDHAKGQRRSTDDERRIQEAWKNVREAVDRFKPHCISVECYTVYGEKDVEGLKAAAKDLLSLIFAQPPEQFLISLAKQEAFLRFVKACDKLKKKLAEGSDVVGQAGRGKAAKTLAVYGAAMAVGWERNIPVFINMPIDLKLKFLGRAKGSKEEVAVAVAAQVQGLETLIGSKVAPSLQEHVYDGAGHAVIGIRNYQQLFRSVGVQGVLSL